MIGARFEWYFETETERGVYEHEYGRAQVRAHSRILAREPGALLFVLTPDPQRPAWLAEPDGVAEGTRERITWLGFRELADAIRTVLADSVRPLGEQTRFLLTELIALYDTDGLLTSDDTVVVAASTAWPEYHRTSAYVCQPDRSFRVGLTHFGFYAEGSVQDHVAAIRGWMPSVNQRYVSLDRLRSGVRFTSEL